MSAAGGEAECREGSNGSRGENPTMEAFVGGETAKVTGKRGHRGPRKGREPSQSAREEGVWRRWETAMVLKTLEAKGQRQGQKWVTAANVLGWKEGVSRRDCRWVGEGCSAENVWGGSEMRERRFSKSLKKLLWRKG